MPSMRLRQSRFVQSPRGAALLRNGLLAIGYGIAFLFAHWIAAIWGGSYFYSLFYPAAGVRFALLWRGGLRLLPLIVITELSVQLLSGVVEAGHPGMLDQAIGVIRTPLSYGLAIALVRWIVKRGGADIATPPMPFALAMVLAPITASLVSFSWGVIRPEGMPGPSTEPAVTTAIAFMLGDLLGVLLLAPPLLVIADLWKRRKPVWKPSLPHGVEAIIVFLGGWALSLAARQVSLGLMLTPTMLTTAWIGLRSGRVGAWITIVLVAIIALPVSQGTNDVAMRLALHMSLAAVAIAGYLAGSYAEAQRRAQRDIARRDRILYQAERLKTLRAMSVAVIHEISQPLSTLSIESRYLAELSGKPSASREEIGEVAQLLERKVGALSDMVRRLRRFGGRAVDEASPISIAALVTDMAAIIAPEAQRARVVLRIGAIPAELAVMGQEIELLQALINLARNAVSAAPGRDVVVTVTHEADQVVVEIANAVAPEAEQRGGMGVGALVARAIVEAHGGHISREDMPDGRVFHRLSLPVVEQADG